MDGNCRLLTGRKMLLYNVYSKTAFVIVYMIVKLMTMRLIDLYFNYYILQYHSKGDVIYYEGLLYWILDAYSYLPVLIGVGGGPTLGQHKYNKAYIQTPGRYTCQKTFRRYLL